MTESTHAATVKLPQAELPSITDRVIETPVGVALGHSARFAGFLSAQRNGKGLKLHITDIETDA